MLVVLTSPRALGFTAEVDCPTTLPDASRCTVFTSPRALGLVWVTECREASVDGGRAIGER